MRLLTYPVLLPSNMITFLNTLIIYILLVAANSMYQFTTAPDLAKLVMAAQADCNIQRHKKSLKYNIEFEYAKIYRMYLMNFNTKEILTDGSLAIEFLPIAFNSHEGTCKSSSKRLFETLINKGWNINKTGKLVGREAEMTILHQVVFQGDLDLVNYLLSNGANPNIRIQASGKKYDKMTSVELAELIAKKKKTTKRTKIATELKTKKREGSG